MRYLITGGAGFIGSHVAEELARRGYEVVILDDLSKGKTENIAHLTNSTNSITIPMKSAGLTSQSSVFPLR